MKIFADFIRRSLERKLIFVTSTVVAFNTLAIGIFSYYQTADAIRNEVEYFSGQVLKQANLNLNRYFLEYEQSVVLIGSSSEFVKWLKVPDGISNDLVQTYREIENNYILPIMYQHPEVLSMTVYNQNGNEMHYSMVGFNGNYSITGEPWFSDSRVMNQSKMVIYPNWTKHYIVKRNNNQPIPIITIVKKVEIGSQTGYLAADISLQPSINILEQMKIGDKTVGFISEPDGRVIAHPQQEMVSQYLEKAIVDQIQSKASGSFFLSTQNEFVIFDTVPYTQWKTIAIIPYNDVAQGILRVRNVTAYVMIASLLLTTVIVVMVSGSITRRIRMLRNSICTIEPNLLSRTAEINGFDEIADLAKTYNRMILHLDSSLKALTQSRSLQQEALMNALQSQINSHFLYNALESINSMANLANQSNIERTTIALSNMLRYTANYLNSTVTVREEINHCLHYLQIMGIRFMDNPIQFAFEVPKECENAICLKAIIQPLIENSIKHGLETTGEPMAIRVAISIYKQLYVQIEVSDNGTGFEPLQLSELSGRLNVSREEMEQQYRLMPSIGIQNVHYRIRMYYKDEQAGLSVGNLREEKGAYVRILFPLQKSS